VPHPVHKDQYFLGKITIGQVTKAELKGVPPKYEQHSKVFSEEESQRLPGHMIWDHTIELLPGAPTTLPGRLLLLTQEEIVEAQKFIKEHLGQGTIWPSWSPYATNFFFVKKKDGKLWPVQDYWPVNKWTKKNHNVLPLIPSVIDWLAGCTLFTKFDIWWGYNNIWIKPGDEWKVAFLTLEGLFKPMVMFFGLTNSLATFQMMMNTIFRWEVQEGWFSIFIDDGIIYIKWWPGETEEQHRQWHWELVHQIFNILVANDLYVKPEKCAFKQEEMEYLGVIMGKEKTHMDPKKLLVVARYPTPTNVTDVHAFLGLTGYYRYFIKGYSKITWPLLDLTKKTEVWHWDKAQEQAFMDLKTCMCQAPILTQLDFNHKFYVQTDMSGYGMGAVLSQEGGSDTLMPTLEQQKKPVLHPIAYYSATFTPTQCNYNIYDRELLAIMMALDHWRQYLGWTKVPFMIMMDHVNLQYWKSPQNLTQCMVRWHLDLQEYDYKILYIPGKENGPPNALLWPPGADQGKEDNQGITILPPEKFKIQTAVDEGEGKIKVPLLEEVKQGILNLVHNHPMAGHPGWDETLQQVKEWYYWPGMKEWIEGYIKGCTTCQQNKVLTHKKMTLVYQILTEANIQPFQRVAMDLITGLPAIWGKDAILTIVDQGCSWVAIFLPCSTTITGPGIAQLYHNHVFWWFGLPMKIISDRDP
jgi:hypothetical protein